MKKKILAGLLLGLVAAGLTACGSEKDSLEDIVITAEPIEGKTTEEESTELEETPETGEEEAVQEEEPVEELPSEEKLFMRFLNGEVTAVPDGNFKNELSYICSIYDYDASEDHYTFDDMGLISADELKEAVDATPDLDLSGQKRYYAVFETVAGKKVLAVKFQNLSIYAPGDSSYALFLFTEKDGQLYLTYAYDSWDRNDIEICQNLIFTGIGSNGAGDSLDWCGYIDETGHYQLVYSRENLYDAWVGMYDWEDFGMETEWSQGCIFSLVTTADGKYYSYEAPEGVDAEKLETFIAYLEREGMSSVDDTENEIAAAYAKSGIARENIRSFEDWTEWE